MIYSGQQVRHDDRIIFVGEIQLWPLKLPSKDFLQTIEITQRGFPDVEGKKILYFAPIAMLKDNTGI